MARPRRRLVRRLGDGTVKGDDRLNVVLTERFSPWGHGSGLPSSGSAQRDDVAHEIVAQRVQRGAIVRQRRIRIQIRAIRGARRCATESSTAEDAAADLEARRLARLRDREARAILRPLIDELIVSYASDDRGIEIREIAGGYRMATKPECHDAVRLFAKSLKPALRLSLPALETLAIIAYKQPVTAPEVNEIRGVDTSGCLRFAAGPQADLDCRAQAGYWPADSLQNHPRVSAPLRPERRLRTALHGGVRKAGRH